MTKVLRPEWLIKSHIKEFDVHGYQALEQVEKDLTTAKK
jgi:hypothetical protein